jgi:hypothetical protein
MPSAANPQFDNESKPVDSERPFHRIHYKDFDATGTKPKPDGFGVDCGCTNKKDFPFIERRLNPDAFVNLSVANDIIKSFFGPIDAGLDILKKVIDQIPGISLTPAAAGEILVKGVKDVWDEIIQLVLPKALRAIPAWVAVKKGSRNDSVDGSQVVEVEGFVTRCYQNASDVPFSQWHHWYNWSIHIRPEHGYDWVAGNVENPPSAEDIDEEDLFEDNSIKSDQHPVTQDKSIECQWDSAALYTVPGIVKRLNDEGDMPTKVNKGEQIQEIACGPMFREDTDWCWPMTGGYAWFSGRWVYDCGKSTKPEGDAKPRNCTMLNPCRAVATARWEAFKFPENDGFVPAIQFMFFTSKRGGYIDHESIADTDYEFIVDLPEQDQEHSAPFPIGHTAKFPADNPPRFPHNTIVLRPRLLKHFDTGAFLEAGVVQDPPIVEVIPPADPSQVPKQVKVTIPLSTMGAADAYGVIISLGWHDPLNQAAEKVKVCTLNINQIVDRKVTRNTPLKDLKHIQDALVGGISSAAADILTSPLIFLPDAVKERLANVISAFIKLAFGGLISLAPEVDSLIPEDELWLIRVGVNGRWFSFLRDAGSNHKALPLRLLPINLGKPIQLRLGERDRLSISVSGAEIDRVGRVMFAEPTKRVIKLDGQRVPWREIAESKKERRERLFVQFAMGLTLMPDLKNELLHFLMTFGLENQPLGFIDAQINPGLHITDSTYPEAKDPIWMDDQPHPFGTNASTLGSSFELKLTAKEAKSIAGPQCVYVEGDDPDYVLSCNLRVEPQTLPKD